MPKNKICEFKSKVIPGSICPKPSLENSGYCIFHKPNKTKEEAKLFKEKIKKKLEKKDYGFVGYYFPRDDAHFKNHTFGKGACFIEATFEEEGDFEGSTFKDEARFDRSIFSKGANFRRSTFNSVAIFEGSIFKFNAWFNQSNFRQTCNFQESTFQEAADFGGAIFQGGTFFRRSTFGGPTFFTGSSFSGWAIFDGLTFNGWADLRNITFSHNLLAEQLFRIAKTCFQREGQYTLAGEYYYKERIAQRKQLPWYFSRKWLEYIFLDALCGYGERPLRAIRTGLGFLFGLALLYWRIGHIYPSPELFKEPDHALTFLDALYFSVVTFTTLGFGDWRPDPSHWIRYVVMSEAFIGAFLMALFIVTFARRMMR